MSQYDTAADQWWPWIHNYLHTRGLYEADGKRGLKADLANAMANAETGLTKAQRRGILDVLATRGQLIQSETMASSSAPGSTVVWYSLPGGIDQAAAAAAAAAGGGRAFVHAAPPPMPTDAAAAAPALHHPADGGATKRHRVEPLPRSEPAAPKLTAAFAYSLPGLLSVMTTAPHSASRAEVDALWERAGATDATRRETAWEKAEAGGWVAFQDLAGERVVQLLPKAYNF